MPTFQKYTPESEKELHGIIRKELDALEEGLELLAYEMTIANSIPDFLCVDSGGTITIIEVKLVQDENQLFQALKYYSDVERFRYVLAETFSKSNVKPQEYPRLILVAETFSEDSRRLSNLVVPEVELYEYTVLLDSTGKKGITFHPVSLPKIDETLAEPSTINDHREYITKNELKPLFDQIRNELQAISPTVEEYTTQGYLGYKVKGRQFAWISPHRKSFDLGAIVIDKEGRITDYTSIRIEEPDEDYSNMMEQAAKSYKALTIAK